MQRREPMKFNLKFLKCKNKICQWIELKTNMKTWGHFFYLPLFTARVMLIKMSKMVYFFVFSAGGNKKSATIWAK